MVAPIALLDGGKVLFSGSREECLAGEILEETFQLCRYTFREGERARIFFASI